MQLDVSLEACVPLATQHDFPPAKHELAANTTAANKAKVVLIMHLRQHELRNVQWVRLRRSSRAKAEGSRRSYLKAFTPSSRVAKTTRDLAYVNGTCKIACVVRCSLREVPR